MANHRGAGPVLRVLQRVPQTLVKQDDASRGEQVDRRRLDGAGIVGSDCQLLGGSAPFRRAFRARMATMPAWTKIA
jgi:hypothetical protein